MYGIGGGHHGEYRINLDQNRIEIDTSNSYSEVFLNTLLMRRDHLIQRFTYTSKRLFGPTCITS